MTKKEVYIPNNGKKTSVSAICIAAHHDDVEIMAAHPILDCYGADVGSFCAVVLTDGAGSARSGPFADFSNEQMKQVRKVEQRRAAELGRYESVTLLNYTSGEVKSLSQDAVDEVAEILLEKRAETVYTHNPFDKHPTHLGAMKIVLLALEKVRDIYRPKRVIGCEVWRDLDWLPDKYKLSLAVDSDLSLSKRILEVYESQIAGGKGYDTAAIGRRYANATFSESHSVDSAAMLSNHIDVTEVAEGKVTLAEFADKVLTDFVNEVKQAIPERK